MQCGVSKLVVEAARGRETEVELVNAMMQDALSHITSADPGLWEDARLWGGGMGMG